MLTRALAWLSVRRVKQMPNLTGVSAMPRRCVRDAALNASTRRGGGDSLDDCDQPVEDLRQRVVANDLAVGRDVAVVAP